MLIEEKVMFEMNEMEVLVSDTEDDLEVTLMV